MCGCTPDPENSSLSFRQDSFRFNECECAHRHLGECACVGPATLAGLEVAMVDKWKNCACVHREQTFSSLSASLLSPPLPPGPPFQ